MLQQELAGNPFTLLLDPAGVHARLAASKVLQGWTGAVHRPLDKPRLVSVDAEAAAYDDAIDAGRHKRTSLE